jgi:hypothetical protein
VIVVEHAARLVFGHLYRDLFEHTGVNEVPYSGALSCGMRSA